MRQSTRRLFVIALAVLSLAGCDKIGALTGSKAAVTAEDMSLGNSASKVTVIEYASVACPFCAHFNNDIFPAFKARYIDTGKIHYVFREMLVGNSDEMTTAAAGFLMARCAGKDKYFSVVDAIFRGQEAMFKSGDVRGALLGVGESAGLTEAQFNACINDEAALKSLNDRVQVYTTRDGIDATPSFVINGKKLAGIPTMASLSAAITAAQSAS